jgi:hypothetical protein
MGKYFGRQIGRKTEHRQMGEKYLLFLPYRTGDIHLFFHPTKQGKSKN